MRNGAVPYPTEASPRDLIHPHHPRSSAFIGGQ